MVDIGPPPGGAAARRGATIASRSRITGFASAYSDVSLVEAWRIDQPKHGLAIGQQRNQRRPRGQRADIERVPSIGSMLQQ